jgi:hypothetical protein
MNRNFSLQALILSVCFIAAIVAVWHNRTPWSLVSSISYEKYDWPERTNSSSPDGSRTIHIEQSFNNPSNSYELTIRDRAQTFSVPLFSRRSPEAAYDVWSVNFVDNDTVQFLTCDPVDDFRARVRTYRRHYPELWWGHLLRPELWVAIVLGALLVWRIGMRLGRRFS